MPSNGMATTSNPKRLTTVACNAMFLAVGLKEFDISHKSSSVRTAESAIVEEKVIAAMRRASCCVAASGGDVAGRGRPLSPFCGLVEVGDNRG